MNTSNDQRADLRVEISLAFVCRGEASDLQAFALGVQEALEAEEGRVKLVFKHASGNKLWITDTRPKEAGPDDQ